MKESNLPLLILLLALPQAVSAHPGHSTGDFTSGFLHPLTGLDHLLAMIAVGLWAVQMKGNALWALPLSFVALMIGGGQLSRLGVVLTAVEPMIASSVLVIGLLVAMRASVPLWLGTPLIGLFAIFHGYAHIAELGSGQVLTYTLGFSLGTALLHGVGILVGVLSSRLNEGIIRVAGAAFTVAGIGLLATA